MNNKDLLKALGEIGEEMAADAEISPAGRASKKTGKGLAGILAAAACLLVGLFVLSKGVFRREPVPSLPLAQLPLLTEEASSAPGGPGSSPPETAPSSALEEGTILWQGEGITVKAAGPYAAAEYSAEALLAYFTERELLTNHLTLRAKVKDIQKLEILNDKAQPPLNRSVATVLTLEPVSVLHGSLKEEGPIRLYINHMINSSLERRNLGVEGKEQEGIFMLWDLPDFVPYLPAVADYASGDNRRFAILEKNDGGLSFERAAFPGFEKNWTLDQAEAYAREVIARDEEAPKDFYLAVSWKYQGEEAEYDNAFRYDSRNGYFSYLGTSQHEKEYGAENLSTYLPEEEELRTQLYNSLIPLKEIEGELKYGSFGRPGMEITLELCLGGRVKEIHYQGLYYALDGADASVKRLHQVMEEIRHYLEESQGMRSWWSQLEKIGAARRSEQSAIIEAALMEAFEKEYGPGGAPDFFRGCAIVAGGYLEIGMHPCTKNNIEIIRRYLREFEGGYLFADPGE